MHRLLVLLKKCVRPLLALMCAWLGCTEASAQDYKLRGTVTDAGNGETLIGAVVKLKDGGGGVVTDIEGKFELIEIGRAHV